MPMFKMDMCNCLKMPTSQFRKLLASLFVFVTLTLCVRAQTQGDTYTNPVNSDSWTQDDTIILKQGNTVKLSNSPTIKEFQVTGDNNILDLNGKTLTITGTFSLGTGNDADGEGHITIKNGTLNITGTFDECDNGNNSLHLINATCKVTGTLFCNGDGTTEITGDANSSFYVPAAFTGFGGSTTSILSFPSQMQPIASVGTYTITTYGVAGPGCTVRITISSTEDFSEIKYKATVYGTGETYTIGSASGDTTISATTDTLQSITQGPAANEMEITLSFPNTIVRQHGIQIELYADDDGTTKLGTPVYYTQQTDTITWTGEDSSEWTTASNWEGGIPGANAIVIIPAGTTYAPILSSESNNLNKLTIRSGANLTIATGGTLNANTISNSGTIRLDDGSISGTSAITLNSGTIDSSGHNLTLGNITILDSGTIKADNITLNDDISSSGTLTFVGQVIATSEIEIAATSTLSFEGAMTAFANIILTAGTKIDFSSNLTANEKTITINAPVLNSTLDSGTVTITANTLSLNQNLVLQADNSPDITLAVSSLTGADYDFTNKTNLTLASEISVEGDFINDSTGSLTCTGNATFKSYLNLTYGSFTHSTGTITLSAANKSPAILSGTCTFQNLSFSGAVNVSNNITVSGELALTGTGAVSFSGRNSIGTFTASGLGGKTISFGTDTTQTVTSFNATGTDASNKLKLTGTGIWNLNANSATVQYVEVKNSNSNSIITAADSTDSGGNTNWIFPGVSYEWVGGTGAAGHENDWNIGTNWSPSSIPGSGASVTIPSGKIAKLVANVDLRAPSSDSSSIEINGTLNLSSYSLAAGTITNKGRVQLAGASGQTITGTISGSDASIVEYTGSIAFAAFAWDENSGAAGKQYKNLTISKPINTNSEALSIGGNMIINNPVTLTGKVSVTGTTTIMPDSETVSLNNNTNSFGDNIILGDSTTPAGNVTLNAATAGITLADNAKATSLTINCPVQLQTVTTTGEQTYSGNISSTGAITLEASKINIDCAAVSTSGNQTYKSPVELRVDTALTSSGGNVTFDSTLNGVHQITLQVPDTKTISVTGKIGETDAPAVKIIQAKSTTFNESVNISSFTDDASHIGFIYFTKGGTIASAVSLNTTGDVSFTGNDTNPINIGSVPTWENLTHTTGNTSITGTFNAGTIQFANTTINGTINATSVNLSALTVADNSTITTTGTQEFNGTINDSTDNTHTLTLNSNSSQITFGNSIGQTHVIKTLTINGPAEFNADVKAGILSTKAATIKCANIETITEGQTFDGAVSIQNDITFIAPSNKLIYFKNSVYGSGTVNLSTNTANSQFDGTVSNLQKLTTAANSEFNDTVSVTGILSNNGLITFARDVTAGTLSTKAATIKSANIETTTEGQTYDGAVSIQNDVTFTSPSNKLIHFKNTVTGTGTENLTTDTGDAQFDGNVSDIKNLIVTGSAKLSGNISVTADTVIFKTKLGSTSSDVRKLTIKNCNNLTNPNSANTVTNIDFIFTGDAGRQTLFNPGASEYLNITTDTIELNLGSNAFIQNSTSDFKITSGRVKAGTGGFTGGNLIVSDGSFEQTGNVADSVQDLTISGSGSITWDKTSDGGSLEIKGTVTEQDNRTVSYNKKSVTFSNDNSITGIFWDLIIPAGKTITNGGTIRVRRNFTITGTYVHNGKTIILGLDTTNPDISDAINGTVTNNAASPRNLGKVIINKGTSATTLTAASDLSFTDINIQSGSFVSDKTLTVQNFEIETNGNFTNNSNGIVNISKDFTDNGSYNSSGTGKLVFNGSENQTFTAKNNSTYYSVEENKTTGTLDITGNPSITTFTLTKGNTTTFAGTPVITNFNDTTSAGNIEFNAGGSITATGGVTFNTRGSVTFDSTAPATMSITGPLVHTAGPTNINVTLNAASVNLGGNEKNITLSGSVFTTGVQSYNGPVTLSSQTELTSTSSTAKQVTFGSYATIDGGYPLIISAQATGTTFNANIGNTTPPSRISITGPLNINCSSIKTTGNQTYGGVVTLAKSGNITLMAQNASDEYQTVQFNGDIDNLNSATQNLIVDAKTNINCTAITLNSVTFNQPVTLLQNTKITTDANDTAPKLVFEKSLSGGTAPGYSLTTAAGSVEFKDTISGISTLDTDATATFDGNVNIGELHTQSININCEQIKTSGNQTYNDTIRLGNNVSLVASSNGQEIDIANNISGSGYTLTINTPILKSIATSNNSITTDKIIFESSTTSIQSTAAILNFSVPEIDGSGEIKLEINKSKISFTGEDITVNPKVTSAVGTTLTASSGRMILNNDVNLANGTFTANNGTIILTGANTTLSGNNTFNNLIIESSITINESNTIANFTAGTKSTGLGGKTITFGAGKTQTVEGNLQLLGTAENSKLILCSSDEGNNWSINCTGTNNNSIQYVDIQDSNNVSTYNLFALNSNDSGNNVNWNFPEMQYTWIGGTSSNPNDWNTKENWSPASIPNRGAVVTIPADKSSYPILTESLDLNDSYNSTTYNGTITVAADAIFDLANENLTVGTITNNGLVRLTGATGQTISGTMKNGTNSTVEYYADAGTATITNFVWDGEGNTPQDGKQYEKLHVNAQVNLSDKITVNNTSTITAGTGKSVTLNNAGNVFIGNIMLGKSDASTLLNAGGVTLNSSNTITLDDNAYADSFICNCPVKLENITTIGNQTYNGLVSLLDSATFKTTEESSLITLNASLKGDVSSNKSLTVDSALKLITTCAFINNLDSATFKKPVEIQSNTKITTAAGDKILFNDAITGTGSLETITGSVKFESTISNLASLKTAATATFNDDVDIVILNTQKAKINCASIISNSATFEDSVILLSDTSITTDASDTATLVFKKDVSSNGSHSLETINGSVIFEDIITGITSLTTDATATFNGNISTDTLHTNIAKINSSEIHTSGTQTYDDTVTLLKAGDIKLTAKNGNEYSTVHFNANINNSNEGIENLIVDAKTNINCESITVNSATFNQPVILLHDTIITTDSADTAKLVFEKSLSGGVAPGHSLTTFAGSVDFGDTITGLSSLTTAAKATFNGNVSAGTITTLHANINCSSITTNSATAANQTYKGAVEILTDTTLSISSGSSGTITFTSTVNGNNKLSFEGGTNNIIFNNKIGKTGTANQSESPLRELKITTAANTTFNDVVCIGTFKDTAWSGDILFKKGGKINAINQEEFNTTGDVVFGDANNNNTEILFGSNLTHITGTTKLYGTLTAPALNITLGNSEIKGTITAENITLGQTKNASITGGPMTISNTGLFKTVDGAFLDFTESFTQNGTGTSMLGGSFTGNGPAIFATSVYLYGSETAEFGTNTQNITIGPDQNDSASNLIFARTDALTINADSVTADNIVFYDGTVNVKGDIISRKDIVILGNEYSTLDPTTGIADEFAYHALRPTHWSKAEYEYEEHMPDETSLPNGTAPNKFGTSLSIDSGKIIHVGKNFYANGTSIEGESNWNLELPKTNDAKNAFAEAINTYVKNCIVTCHEDESEKDNDTAPAKVVAYGSKDKYDHGGNNGNWLFDDFEITDAWTVRDNSIYVEFNQPIRNLDNEFNNEISYLTYKGTTATQTSYTAIYSDPDCKSQNIIENQDIEKTDGKYFIYINAPDSWNTDATGTSQGTDLSTDRNGSHKTSIPYLDIPRSLEAATAETEKTKAFIITNKWGKKLNNYSTRTPTKGFAYGTDETAGNETYVLDHTGPVLVQVRTGQETHETSLAAQNAYDSHNFIEFIYSEPVNFGNTTDANDADKLNTSDWIPAYEPGTSATPNTPQNIKVSSSLGYLPENGSLTFAGLNQTIEKGKIKTASTGTSTQDVNAFYRQSTHSIKYSLAGYADNVETNGTINGDYINWAGYIDSETSLPNGTVTFNSTPENLVTDCATESDGTTPLYNHQIMNKPDLEVNNSEQANTNYGVWDLQPPVFVKAHKKGEDNDQDYYEAIGNGDGSTLNRIEIHISDNPSSLTNEISKNGIWLTRYGWASSIEPSTARSPAADKLIGGARPYATSDKTSGGLRYCTILNQENAFKYSDKITSSPNKEFVSITSGASASYFVSSTDNRNEIPTEKDNTYINLELSDTNLPYETSFTISYNDSNSYITDLAGNRLRTPDTGIMNTVDRTPPDFKITFAPIGSNKLLLIFVKKLTNNIQYYQKNSEGIYEEKHITDFEQTIPYCFEIGKITDNSFDSKETDLQIDTSEPATKIDSCSNDYYTAIELTLTRPVTLEDVKNCYIRLKEVDNDHIRSKDILTNLEGSYVSFIQDDIGNYMQMYQAHALSDFASGIIDPLYAYNDDLEYNEENISENLYSSGSWAIHDWNEEQKNYGTLIAQKPVTVIANIDENNLTSDTAGLPEFSLRMYFSTPSPDADSQSEKFNSDIPENKLRLWMPTIDTAYNNGLFPAYSEKTNSNYSFTDGLQSESNLNQFSFEINTEKCQSFTSGKQISFLFGLFDSTGTVQENICLSPILTFSNETATYNIENKVPLYLIRLKDPSQITSMDLWSFKVKDIKSQRGGVTILNNVINATNGEKTVLKVDVPTEGRLNVMVMTLDGNIITYLHRGNAKAGENYFTWDGKNRNGNLVARGMYFIRVTGADFDETRKVMVVK